MVRKLRFDGEIIDHQTGIEYILGILTSKDHGCLNSLKEIDAVGRMMLHMVVKLYKGSAFIDDDCHEDS